jgi:hypothetical protein
MPTWTVPVVELSERLCDELNSTHHKKICTQLKYLSTLSNQDLYQVGSWVID